MTRPIRRSTDFITGFSVPTPDSLSATISTQRTSSTTHDFPSWEIRDQLHIDRSLRSFLITSVHRRCLNWIRQHSHQPATCAIPKDGFLNFETSAHPLSHLLEKELEEKIRTAIEALPHETRQVFELSRYDDMTYDEIAQHLSISVNTVKYHMKSALRQLYDQLEPYLFMLLFIG
jgi:RNA polymerase sigma-70 factor (ECF subfamily)